MGFLDFLGPIGSIASAGIGLLGNLIGGSQEASAQENANATNLQIAQETNAANKAIHESDNAFNAEQAEITRQWNTPANQRRLLEAAGYNPMLKDAQLTQTQASANSPLAMQAARVDPVTGNAMAMQRLGEVADRYWNAQQASANSEYIRQKSLTESVTRQAQLEKLRASSNLDRATANRIKLLQQAEKDNFLSMIQERNSTIGRNEKLNEFTDKQIQLAEFQKELYDSEIAKNHAQAAVLTKEFEAFDEKMQQTWYQLSTGRIDANAAMSRAMTEIGRLQFDKDNSPYFGMNKIQKKAYRTLLIQKAREEVENIRHNRPPVSASGSIGIWPFNGSLNMSMPDQYLQHSFGD